MVLYHIHFISALNRRLHWHFSKTRVATGISASTALFILFSYFFLFDIVNSTQATHILLDCMNILQHACPFSFDIKIPETSAADKIISGWFSLLSLLWDKEGQ